MELQLLHFAIPRLLAFGGVGVLELVIGGIVVWFLLSLTMRNKHHRRHQEYQQALAGCEHPWARKRRRGHGFGWLLVAIVVGVIALRFLVFDGQSPRGRLGFSRFPRAPQPIAVDARMPFARVDSVGRPESALEIRLRWDDVRDHDLDADDLAVGLLTIYDRLREQDGLERHPVDFREIEKTIVSTNEEGIELRQVARLSRRMPIGRSRAPIGDMRVKLDARHDSQAATRFMIELARELNDVFESREPAPQLLAPEPHTLVVRIPTDDDPLIAVAPVPPIPPVAPAAPVPPMPPVPAVPPVEPGAIDRFVDSSLGWVLGQEDREEVKRAISEAHRDVAREMAEASAEKVRQVTGVESFELQEKIKAAIAAEKPRPATAPAAAKKPGPPDWVVSPPELGLGENHIYTITGATGALFSTPQESRQALAETLDRMIREYADFVIGPRAANEVDLAYLRSRAITWTGSKAGPLGMQYYETHAKLELGPSDHNHLLALAQRARGQRAAVAGGAVLLVLATMLGYFKLDTATRGYYSGRLKLAAGTVAVAVVALAALFFTGELRL